MYPILKLLPLLLLTACAVDPVVPTHMKTKVVVYALEQDHEYQVDEFCKKKLETNKDYLGCAYNTELGCIIVFTKPNYSEGKNMCVIGHEFYHCIRGWYHE